MPTMTQAGYTPPKPRIKKEPPKPKKSGKKKKHARRLNGAAVASLLIFVIAAGIGAATIYLYTQTQPYAHTYLHGVSVAGYPLGGATQEEAVKLLERITADSVSGWSFEMTHMGQTYTLTARDVGLGIDVQATLDPLWQIGRSGGMVSRYRQMMKLRQNPVDADTVIVYQMEPVDVLLERIAADIEREAVSASMTFSPESSRPFQITDEVTGLALHTQPLRAQIEEAIQQLVPVKMVLVPQEIAPAVYRSELESAIELRSRVVMETANDDAAFTNILIATEKLNGICIGTDERFSFNTAVGRRTAEEGYLPAMEQAYGIGISGVGGGICQVSTVLYRAALLAGLDVEERSAAVYPVDYCETGQEAAVSEQGLDLVLKNTTAYPLFIKARAYRDEDAAFIELQIIGEPMQERYVLESKVTETGMMEEPIYIRDREGKYARYTDERVSVGSMQPGYRAKVERVAIDENGHEVSREMISEDTYEAIPPTIYVGIEER